MLYRFWEDGRKRPLTIIGSRGTEEFLTKILKLAYRIGWKDLSFRVKFLIAEPGRVLRYQGVRLSFAQSNHPVINLAVRFDWKGRAFAISGDGNLVIHEAFQDEVFQPVHASMSNVIEVVHMAGAKRLGLIHLSRHFRSRALVRSKRYVKPGMRIFIARPGQVVTA